MSKLGCSVLLLLAAALSNSALAAPTPPGATISPATTVITYTSGPLSGINPSGTTGVVDPVCIPNSCDDFALTIDLPQSYRDTHEDDVVLVRLSWTNASNDFDAYWHDPADKSLTNSATSANPETMALPISYLPNGTYTIRMVTYDVETPDTYTGTISLIASPDLPPPPSGRLSGVYLSGTDLFSCNTHLRGESPLGNHDGDSEPGIKIDKDGKAYVGGLGGTPTGGIGFWRVSDPCAQTFDFIPIPDGSLGGGDVDVEIAPVKNANGFYNIYTSSLVLPNITSSVSMDGGATFIPNVLSDQTPVNDRQWNACYGANTLWLSFRQLNSGNQLLVYRSDNAGLPGTFVGPFPVYLPDLPTMPGIDAQLGNMVCDQRPGANLANPALPMAGPNGEGNLYHGFMNTASPPKIYVAVSKDFGVTWHCKLVYTGVASDNFRFDFSSVAVDQAGNVYTAWSDEHYVYYAVSGDQGEHWSAPYRVSNGAGTKTSMFPFMDAGSAGRLVFTWYGASSSLGSSNPGAKYHVWFARCDNALAPLSGDLPVFEQVRVTDHVMHTGPICLQGTACTSGRELAEDFEIGIDPSNGGAMITYTDNGAEGGTYVARQIAGKSSISGKTVVDHSLECPRNTDNCKLVVIGSPCSLPGIRVASDDVGDAQPQDDHFDIEWVAVAEPQPDRVVLTMKVKSLSPTLFPVGTVWRMAWSGGGASWFARMLSCPTGVSYDYGTVGTVSTIIGPADGGTYSPDGTISITMLKSHIGNPTPGSVLAGVTGSTRAQAGVCPPPPGPAGVAEDIDVSGSGSYTLIAPGYCGVVPTLVQNFTGAPSQGGVDLQWSAEVAGDVVSWNLYRGAGDGAMARVNSAPIPVGQGGSAFRYHDAPSAGGTYTYRLAGVRGDGGETTMAETQVQLAGPAAPLSLTVAGANPFRGRTALTYSLPRRSPVEISVYTVTGQRVATLVDRVEEAGPHGAVFDVRQASGRAIGAGFYIVRMRTGEGERRVRLIALD